MQKIIKNILWVILILFAISLIFSFTQKSFFKSENQISFSELVSKIKSGDVQKIVQKDNDLTVFDKSNNIFKSTKEPDASLSESFKNYGLTPQQISSVSVDIQSGAGWELFLNIFLSLLPIIIIGLIFWSMTRQAQKGAAQIFSFGRANVKLFNPFAKEKVTFKDVAGLLEAKQELEEVVDFLKNPDKFVKIGARIPRGVILVGPPGTGKTLLARAVAGEANVPFFHISGSEFVEMFVGVGASRVRDTFNLAKKSSPSILFIDEIDAVGRQRGAGLGGGHDEREQTLNQILVEMDGFDREVKVVVIAATNRPDILDPALLRPGRFDRRVFLDLPNIKERIDILKIHLKDKKVSNNINLKRLAERTPGFSGADLANLVNEAAILAARRNKEVISSRELLESIEKVMLGPERRSRILSENEKKIAAYHESGHAVVANSLPHTDPVHKVTIIPRGRAAGYTLKLPSEDKNFRSRVEFIEELAVMLGGYAAEKIIFGDITTGGANDLKEASGLARQLVTKYGMSEAIGPITYGETQEMIFLGREISTEKNYSEETAHKIDLEIEKLMKNALDTAISILKQRKSKLGLVAQTLIKKETIEKEEFEKLMKTS